MVEGDTRGRLCLRLDSLRNTIILLLMCRKMCFFMLRKKTRMLHLPKRGKYKLKKASPMLKAKILSPQCGRRLATSGNTKTHNGVRQNYLIWESKCPRHSFSEYTTTSDMLFVGGRSSKGVCPLLNCLKALVGHEQGRI